MPAGGDTDTTCAIVGGVVAAGPGSGRFRRSGPGNRCPASDRAASPPLTQPR
ncbi:hypothetical protein [Amycolatopsis sp. NPDC051903]|uniref:hypothetical protein n=1 Tax=Amycolatopsis sp. NPDC051903 TaxID=3363936 RepID=UPI0037A15E08